MAGTISGLKKTIPKSFVSPGCRYSIPFRTRQSHAEKSFGSNLHGHPKKLSVPCQPPTIGLLRPPLSVEYRVIFAMKLGVIGMSRFLAHSFNSPSSKGAKYVATS